MAENSLEWRHRLCRQVPEDGLRRSGNWSESRERASMRSCRDRMYAAKGAARTESLRGGKQLASAAARARRPNEQNVANRGLRVLRRSDLTELRQSRRTRTVFRVGWEHAGRSKQQGEKNRRTKPVILVVWLVSVSSFGSAGLVVTPETTARQAPQSMGLPRPGRVATRSSGDLPDPGSEPRLLPCRKTLPSEPPGKSGSAGSGGQHWLLIFTTTLTHRCCVSTVPVRTMRLEGWLAPVHSKWKTQNLQ